MTGLSKITDKILAEARAEAARKLAEADERAGEISRAAVIRAGELRAKVDEAAKREAAGIVSRAKSSEAMIHRNTLLEEKSAMIDEVFEAARKEILSLSGDEYLAFLTALSSSVLSGLVEDERTNRELYGEEAEDVPYEILLNSRDGENYGKALQKALPSGAILSPDAVSIDGGLIVRHGRIEVNCSVGALIQQIRPSLEAKVNHTLFPDKVEPTAKKGS